MKKYIVILILLATTLSSCAYYTCPTYGKTSPQKAIKDIKRI